MENLTQIEFQDIDEEKEYEQIIEKVVYECFKEEKLLETKLYMSIILTNKDKIQELNNTYRKINKTTDVLSFPMFEKDEIDAIIKSKEYDTYDVLGDIVISIDRVKEQAIEYGHSFKRELAYMVVHGFYHLMGYDHIKEEDKEKMRPKEEKILQELNITRDKNNVNV